MGAGWAARATRGKPHGKPCGQKPAHLWKRQGNPVEHPAHPLPRKKNAWIAPHASRDAPQIKENRAKPLQVRLCGLAKTRRPAVQTVEKQPVSGVFRLPHKGLHACGKHGDGKPVPQGEICGKGMDREWKARLPLSGVTESGKDS